MLPSDGEVELKQRILNNFQHFNSTFNYLLAKNRPDQLIKQQKIISRSIVRLQKICQFFGQSFGATLQSECSSQIIRNLYFEIKRIIKQKIAGEESFQIYEYLLKNKFKKIMHNNVQVIKSKMGRNLETIMSNSELKQTILKEFRNDQTKQVPPENLEKNVAICFKAFKVNKQLNQQLIIRDLDLVCNPQRQEALSKILCSMFNNSNSIALYVGVNKNQMVEGVQLKKSQLQPIRENVEKAREKFIFPNRRYDEKFHVNFIKVQSIIKPEQKTTKYQSDQILKDEALYIIKIYTNTISIGQTYFFIEDQKNYKIYKFNKQYSQAHLVQKQIYQQMHWEHYQKEKRKVAKQLFKTKIVAEKNNFSEPTTQYVFGGKIYLKEEQLKKMNIQYGRLPAKKYAHHSIVVVSSGEKARAKFEELKNYIRSDKQYFEYYQIFEKLNKTTSREVYYMSHRKNPQQLLTFSLKIDDERRYIVFNKIKPQLSFLKDQFVGKAYQLMTERYQHYLGKKLKLVYKRLQKNYQNSYFLCFEDELQAIFAFCLLEYSNIRTNFANKNKIQGTIPVEQAHLKQILKKLHQ